jgi:hypothetical protein
MDNMARPSNKTGEIKTRYEKHVDLIANGLCTDSGEMLHARLHGRQEQCDAEHKDPGDNEQQDKARNPAPALRGRSARAVKAKAVRHGATPCCKPTDPDRIRSFR